MKDLICVFLVRMLGLIAQALGDDRQKHLDTDIEPISRDKARCHQH